MQITKTYLKGRYLYCQQADLESMIDNLEIQSPGHFLDHEAKLVEIVIYVLLLKEPCLMLLFVCFLIKLD